MYLGIEQDSSITYTNSVRGKWSKENGVNYRAENWSPMYCTAIGKLILAQHELGALESFLRFTPLIAYTKNTITRQEELMAELEDIRSKGYALDMEESNDGISSIAAPIYNYANRMIAGIAVIAPSSRLTQERIKVLLPKLLDAAGVISKNMGFRGEMAGLIF